MRDRTCRVNLTDRDKSLLVDLFLLKAARREHLERLHFGSLSRCNQRLRSLFDAGLIDRYESPYGQLGPIVYSLGKAGSAVVSAAVGDLGGQLSGADFRRQCQKAKAGLLAHTLAVADVYVALRTSMSSGSPLRLVQFLPESVVRHEFDLRRTGKGGNEATEWRQVTVAPDGCFIVQDADSGLTAGLLLEADRGDTGSQIESKLHGYAHFIRSGMASQAIGVPSVSVVFVTTGRVRARNLCNIAVATKFDEVFVTTFDDIDRFEVHRPMWLTPRSSGEIDFLQIVRRKGC